MLAQKQKKKNYKCAQKLKKVCFTNGTNKQTNLGFLCL